MRLALKWRSGTLYCTMPQSQKYGMVYQKFWSSSTIFFKVILYFGLQYIGIQQTTLLWFPNGCHASAHCRYVEACRVNTLQKRWRSIKKKIYIIYWRSCYYYGNLQLKTLEVNLKHCITKNSPEQFLLANCNATIKFYLQNHADVPSGKW